MSRSDVIWGTKEKKELISILFVLPIYFFSLFSTGTSDVDYFSAWSREFVHGNFYELFQLNSSQIFEYSIGQSTTSTYPYPPIAVILLGTFGLIMTYFFGESSKVFIFSANLLSLVALIAIAIILHRDRIFSSGADCNKALSFLLNPFVLLLFILLGYQDAVSAFLVLLAMKKIQIKQYIAAGLFFSLAIFTKQLALLVLLPSLVLFLSAGVKPFSRFLIGLFWGFIISLSPFIFSSQMADVLSKLLQSSVHHSISANAYNFPWIINVIRSLFAGQNVFVSETQSIPLDTFSVWTSLSAYDFFSYFYFLFLFLFLFALIKFRKNSLENLPIVSVICVLGYYLFAPSVHENHFIFILPLVLWALTPRDLWIFHLLTVIPGVNCFLRYGVGRNWSKSLGLDVPSVEIMNYFGLSALFILFFVFFYLIYKLFRSSDLDLVKVKTK